MHWCDIFTFSIFDPRFVFDALRMPLETNMAWFGVLALDRFRDRLREYPKFCKEVFKIPHFEEGKNKDFESSQT